MGISARQSPDISHDMNASCCNSQKLSTRAASQSGLSAHSAHSRSICLSRACAASVSMPRTSRSIVGFSRRPRPTTFVRMVLIAPVARGTPIYRSRERWRNTSRLSSISSRADPPLYSHPAIDFLYWLAP